MFLPLENRLILQKQRRSRHEFNPIRGNFPEKRRTRAQPRAKPRNQHRSIQHDEHLSNVLP